MATTQHSILAAEPSRVHTISSLTALVSAQAHTYLLTKPYALRCQPWLRTQIDRLLFITMPIQPTSNPARPTMPSNPTIPSDPAHPTAGRPNPAPPTSGQPNPTHPAAHPARLFSKVAMSEDLLLLLNSILSYRIEICKHATAYKDVVRPGYKDCAGWDGERKVARWLRRDASPQDPSAPRTVGEEREGWRKGAVRRQGRMMVLQGVIETIERAELFAKPPGKYAARNRDAKGVVYLALVVLKCVGEGAKVESVVGRLGAVKHEICRANVYHPTVMLGYGGPGTKGMMT